MVNATIFAFDEGERWLFMMSVHEVVTVLYAMRFHGLDAILDQLAHFVSISCVQFFSPGNWYLFCDTRSQIKKLAIFCLPQVCLSFFSRFWIKFF